MYMTQMIIKKMFPLTDGSSILPYQPFYGMAQKKLGNAKMIFYYCNAPVGSCQQNGLEVVTFSYHHI